MEPSDPNSHRRRYDDGRRHNQSRAARPNFGGRPRFSADRRALMTTKRETTPERLTGMAGGPASFRNVDNLSESEASMEFDSDSGDVADLKQDQPSKKRVKLSEEPTKPKWSNPDPYTSLPPPDATAQGKRKDVVHLIRKAKIAVENEQAGRNEVSQNADFISLNFDDEDEGWKAPNDVPTKPAFPGREIKAATGAKRGKQKAQVPDVTPLHTGKKRKHTHVAAVLPEWWIPRGSAGTPWCTRATDHSNIDRMVEWLHLEMVDFYDHVKPCVFEQSLREDLVNRLRKHVQKNSGLPCDVKCFGSFAQGTYLPTGDMDIVVVSKTFEQTGNRAFVMNNYKKMYQFFRTLTRAGLASHTENQIIAKARVPIIKYVDPYTRLNVDISFENLSGVVAIRTYQDWATEFPILNVFVAIIKQFLKMRGLNEVVNGGIGGFSISCLVYSWLKLHPKILSKEIIPEQCLGELLMDFFDFYGRDFDVTSTAIQMRPPMYISKNNLILGGNAKIKPERLTIIDPNNPTNDISGGSSRISTIFAAFRAAHGALEDRMDELRSMPMSERKGQSILGVVLAGNYITFETQRDHLEDTWDRRGRR
ncbi:Nucleotidyltransferase [Eremomyces bilateralis CBS 781.70]|uniref:polynucleotide adenylyltransferase n=1 Tax=Eremomyces bilateralis CBS 781.70 TaxID=1392243 RepID=A0A6G1G457_9PEZI|nr:Nucleotidyltransferase [Eremomyces bilateralis CBS 781.70]KAF1812885.1 Nucleotidyltransferase [Eremomyces bilateralis CBS 781.70]